MPPVSADYLGMTGGATFAEVLGQKLAAFAPPEPVVVPAPPTFSYQAPPPLLFSKRALRFNATAYGAGRVPPISTPLSHVAKQSEPPPRPARPLTTKQRRALDELIALGAQFHGEFNARALRSVYRTLARRYHPDRHPSSDRAEQARLARIFARLNESHRLLQTAFPDPAAER
jgi:hypothetical protein